MTLAGASEVTNRKMAEVALWLQPARARVSDVVTVSNRSVILVAGSGVRLVGQRFGAAGWRRGDGAARGQVRELGVERRTLGADPRHPLEVAQRRRAGGGPLQRHAVPPRVVHIDR